jgi:hypothetical protein
MSSTGTDSLVVVLAFVYHLVVIDGSNLWVIFAGYIASQEGKLLDQVWPCLGYVQPFAFNIATLTTVWDETMPTAEMAAIRETGSSANVTREDGSDVFAHPI